MIHAEHATVQLWLALAAVLDADRAHAPRLPAEAQLQLGDIQQSFFVLLIE